MLNVYTNRMICICKCALNTNENKKSLLTFTLLYLLQWLIPLRSLRLLRLVVIRMDVPCVVMFAAVPLK